eukprot:scaffold17239_cov76-Phaeocystis_antarctica.AAC.1
MFIARPARYQAAQHSVPRAECQACLARCGDAPGRVEPRGDHDARARRIAWYAARTYNSIPRNETNCPRANRMALF